MKILGYIFCALAVVIGVLMLVDALFLESAGQIWDPLDYVISVALAVCVIVGVRDYMTEGGRAIGTGVLLSIFAFLVFTETFIAYMSGSEMATMQWMWADAIAVIALLREGGRLTASE
ncbi:MAG: hypothetical protein OXG15_01070 [Gammaproteobacteria bacterium]|nr:hypothetical protein [Gammaproteobacteria bacterium]